MYDINFDAFEQHISLEDREKVLYLNLNYNFIGGTLPASLPRIFPNLRHLS